MLEIIPMTHRTHQMYNPFKEMENLEKAFFGNSFFNERAIDIFKTDIREENGNYILEADLPGFDKKDINIDLTDEFLTIKAERKTETDTEDTKKNYISRERSYGSYTRRFEVSGIDTENIGAKYENGVLTLTMPRKAPEEPTSRKLVIE